MGWERGAQRMLLKKDDDSVGDCQDLILGVLRAGGADTE